MDELKQEAIKSYYAELVECMDPLRVMDRLAKLLSLEDMELIRESHSTYQERNRKLISILLRKREEREPFERFVEALKRTDASHENMAEAILKTYKHDNGAIKCEEASRFSRSHARETGYGLEMCDFMFLDQISFLIFLYQIDTNRTEMWVDIPKLGDAVQQSLKEMYRTRFQKVYPFSLPFTFHIEKTWVSLALKDYNKELDAIGYFTSQNLLSSPSFCSPNRWTQVRDITHSAATEDHAALLKKAFDKVKMLIIEGNPATGKTSLMRRLAYEWANGKQELLHYDLLLYAEFREVREKTFKSIADLVLSSFEKYLDDKETDILRFLLNDKQFSQYNHILVLLDGYDESSLENQCSEISSYTKEKTIKKPLLFNTVITTRKGYLSYFRGREGRFVFSEVLGFTTKLQKEKYICNHFLSSEMDNQRNLAAVHSLINNNENLNKLAETPLFLTFICLVHERIVDGTLLELYCNIIWWLIDRHQQDFPDRDIPYSFGFKNGFDDKFETIQDHYLHFPQLHRLGNMALHNIKKDIFEYADCEKFNLHQIIEQVGLLRKERKHDKSFKLVTSLYFPHRTIQELLAAFYCYCSNDPTSEWLLPDSKLDTSKDGMNEFERFLLRIALSDKMPIQAEKRKYYFDRITDINLDLTFDAFNTATGFNNELLNWFLSQCKNVQNIRLTGTLNSTGHASNMVDTSIHNESTITFNTSSPTSFSFSDLIKLHSVWFQKCTFSASSQLSFTNCQSLKNLKFERCEMESSTNLGIATLPAIHTVEFSYCSIDLATWQSITDHISNSNVKYLKLTFGRDFNKEFLIHLRKCNNIANMEITIRDYTNGQNDLLSFSHLIRLHSLTFGYGCTLSANSELSFTECPSLKNLKFERCEMERSTIVGIATLPAIDTVQFHKCNIDLATWQSITDQISNSYVKCLQLSADFFRRRFSHHSTEDTYSEFLHHLQKCERVQQIHVNDTKDSNNRLRNRIFIEPSMESKSSNILKRYEKSVTADLALTAQKLPALMSIIISNEYGRKSDESERLSERNLGRIEKAGQQRNPHFSIKYVENSDPREPQPVKSGNSWKCNII